jgi:hypothetical protein
MVKPFLMMTKKSMRAGDYDGIVALNIQDADTILNRVPD